MNTSPGKFLSSSAKTWPLVHHSVPGNGGGRCLRRLWMAAVMVLVLAAALMLAACGGGEAPELVPEGATLIAEIEVADILEKVDFDSLLDALPDEEDVPQTLDEVLDLFVEETGVDLRDISRAILYGDPQRDDNYFGVIVRGTFDEEGLVAAIQEAVGEIFLTETYKGRDLHIPPDDPDSFVFTLLNEETLVLGNPDAVRHVIDVQEGDRNRAEGEVNAAVNDLPRGLVRLAVAVPPEALQDVGTVIEGLLGQQDLIGGLPISLESLDKLEIFGFALGQDGDTLKFQVRLDFADQESASTVEDLVEGLLKVAGALAPEGQDLGFLDRVQVDREGSRVTLSLDLQISDLKDLLEGVFGIAQEESFREEVSPARAADHAALQAAIDTLMADNRLVRVATPTFAVNEFSGLDLAPGDGEAYLTPYLRETTTNYYYCWTEQGRVLFGQELPSSCPQRAIPTPHLLFPGEEVAIMPTKNHLPEGQSVAYSTTPPTSGDHWERWADCGFYSDGLPDELIVHNLEHGNIVVSYNLSDQNEIASLRRSMSTIALAEDWGVTRYYDKIPEGTVAIAAWGRRARMPVVDLDNMAGFFAANAGAVGPERIAC